MGFARGDPSMTGVPESLERLLRPQSLAVVGGEAAVQVIRQCRRLGYEGEIWPVHPERDVLEGIPAVPSVRDLPAPPDAAFVGVNRRAAVGVVAALAAGGAGGAVVYASGFKEVGGEGLALTQDLVAAAGPLPLIGPNCYGFLNYLDGIAVWPDEQAGRRVDRGVAIIAQSGNIAINLTMIRRALPIAYVFTLGNQAVLGLGDLIDAMVADDRVTAIGLYIEGLDDPDRFQQAVMRARTAGKPVVAVKVGRTEAGRRQAMSHTASLVGGDAAMQAFFERIGVARVASLTGLLEALTFLHVHGPVGGRRVVAVTSSGAEAALVADEGSRLGLDFPEISPPDRARIGDTCHPLVTIANPFDHHTFDWGNRGRLAATFAEVMAVDSDLALLVLDFPPADLCDPANWYASMDAWVDAVRATRHDTAIIASLPDCLPNPLAAQLLAAGIAPLSGIEDGLAAIAAAVAVGGFPSPVPIRAPAPLPVADGAAVTVPADQARRLLSGFGVRFAPWRVAESVAAAVAAADSLGYPVAVKAEGAGLAHKTEKDALRLALTDRDAVAAAAESLLALSPQLLVERMVTGAVAELIIGAERDPVLGPHLVLGAGGVLVELLADSRILLLPVCAAAVDRALDELRVGRLLGGWRGRPAADRAAIVETVLAVGRFLEAYGDRFVSLDMNPVMATPDGAVTVDVLMQLSENPE